MAADQKRIADSLQPLSNQPGKWYPVRLKHEQLIVHNQHQNLRLREDRLEYTR
jgi:hypothetical protein